MNDSTNEAHTGQNKQNNQRPTETNDNITTETNTKQNEANEKSDNPKNTNTHNNENADITTTNKQPNKQNITTKKKQNSKTDLEYITDKEPRKLDEHFPKLENTEKETDKQKSTSDTNNITVITETPLEEIEELQNDEEIQLLLPSLVISEHLQNPHQNT